MEIYDDQTGKLIYPKKDKEIIDKELKTKYFINQVDLEIRKIRKELEIICFVSASKRGFSRNEGYYIKDKLEYSNNAFEKFKNKADKILNELNLMPDYSQKRNQVFNKLANFDKTENSVDVETIVNIIKSNFGNLNYKSDNISDTTIGFCSKLLKKLDNITITISSKKNELGNVNIYINELFEKKLAPFPETEKLIKNYKEENGKRKIKDAFDIINKEILKMQKEGHYTDSIRKIIIKEKNSVFRVSSWDSYTNPSTNIEIKKAFEMLEKGRKELLSLGYTSNRINRIINSYEIRIGNKTYFFNNIDKEPKTKTKKSSKILILILVALVLVGIFLAYQIIENKPTQSKFNNSTNVNVTGNNTYNFIPENNSSKIIANNTSNLTQNKS